MRRLLTFVLAALILAGVAPTDADAARFRRDRAARDFATTTWGDAWDFSNDADLLLDDGGPTVNLIDARIADGQFKFSIDGEAYFSPLWGGYPGALYQKRDGGMRSNQVPTDTYGVLSFHAYSSRTMTGGVFWFNCEGLNPSCMGGQQINLYQGWRTYQIPLYQGGGFAQQWTGRLTGLRIALSPEGQHTDLRFDWMRLVPRGVGPYRYFRSDDHYDTNDRRYDNDISRPGWGEVPCEVWWDECAHNERYSLKAFPPATYRFYNPMRRLPYTDPTVLLERTPAPVVLDPDVSGGKDFNGSDRWCDCWDMKGNDVLAIGNADQISYSGGGLHATNAPPTQNDPYVWLRVREGGIQGRRFHRLTVTSSYEGPFGLEDAPGGGTHGRVVWRDAEHGDDAVMQTKEWVTYEGVRSLTIDLRQPGVFETDVGNRHVWGEHGPITALRWDPNEDRGRRRWHLWHVKLAQDDQAFHDRFRIRWRDTEHTDGATTRIYADADRGGYDGRLIAIRTQQRGENSYEWDATAMAPGRYWIHVETTTPSGLSRGRSYATGPLVVR